MLALRYVGLIALTVWIGGLLVLGAIGAPAIFGVVDARHVAEGRALAGAIFGEAFRRFTLVSYGCGALVLGTLVARAVLGPRPMRFALRLATATAMVAASAYSGFIVTPAIVRQQAEIEAALANHRAADAYREAFGRLHAISTGVQLVPLLGGLMLLFWEVKE